MVQPRGGLLVYLLPDFGHSPLTARDLRCRLEVARRQAPDFILCDIQLADIDGHEIARQIQAGPVPGAPVRLGLTGAPGIRQGSAP